IECLDTLMVFNSTVAGNAAPASGVAGIDSKGGGTVLVRSSIIARNLTGAGTLDLDVTGPLTVTNSLIGTNQGTPLEPTGPTPAPQGNLVGSAARPLDPLLVGLGDNGGHTQTMAPLPGSPAVDRGSNTIKLSTDQRGGDFARLAGVAVDMGAVELQPHAPP